MSLARLPTPLHRLERLSRACGAEIWVKRDDLTGFGLSGNKVRKLEYLLEAAVAEGADTVLTTGGIQSNHARATAIAARMLGLEPVLLLRGERPHVSDANLLLDDLLGARVEWCTEAGYADRDALLAELADDVRRAGGRPYTIPEGGSNALGSAGFVAAADEVRAQVDAPFDRVVCAVGSGGTLAGLAMGADLGPVRGVAVCDDAATFRARVQDIAGDRPLEAPGGRWDVVEGYQGPGYGIATPEVWDAIRTAARLEGLLLDPVYTGKAMAALLAEVAAGRWGGRILFWHTGGAFGLFGRGNELA